LEAKVAEAAGVGDHAALAALGTEVAAVQAEVAAAEERWLEAGTALETRA
jgi:hypothetical protein